MHEDFEKLQSTIFGQSFFSDILTIEFANY